MTEDKDKLIGRIRRLYAMSQDASSPAEAAIAAKRVRSMMDAEGLTEADLKASDYSRSGVRFSAGAVPPWIGVMAVAVARYNDCITTGKRGHGTLEFCGYDVDVAGAKMMIEYLVASCDRTRRPWLHNSRADILTAGDTIERAHNDYNIGYAVVVQRRVFALCEDRDAELQTGDGRALVPLKMAMVAQQFGEQKSRSGAAKTGLGGFAGSEAGSQVGLNPQVAGGGEGGKLLH